VSRSSRAVSWVVAWAVALMAVMTAWACSVAFRATSSEMPSTSSRTHTSRVHRACARRRRSPSASIARTARLAAARVADRVPFRAMGSTRRSSSVLDFKGASYFRL
jgi:hypothetical protein